MSRGSTTRTRDSNSEILIIEKRNHIGRVVLNRPHALNAVDDKMGRELAEALQNMETDQDVRCLVLTGAGRAFCAGEDVPGFKARNFASLGRLLEEKYHPIIRRIRSMEKPVIAGVNGIAAGGGGQHSSRL